MLKDLFYIESINKESENRITAIAGMNGKNPVFLGHFPGKPVLPGVCSLFLVRECLERFLGMGLKYKQIDFCKFPGMTDPEKRDKIFLRISWEDLNDRKKIKAEMNHGSLTVLKLRAVLTEI
ncbi:MAG TPA: beta-hydroxyacyl-ACP dehydratase [Bacteroidales bacterium]|nr:beta-hydroxyacyl-ACP dehydratase [Bacteroidales bacterium]HPJ55340.1 beta-hydroxyacyl-ACP dehydratase [Bacteroidales bacterium]